MQLQGQKHYTNWTKSTELVSWCPEVTIHATFMNKTKFLKNQSINQSQIFLWLAPSVTKKWIRGADGWLSERNKFTDQIVTHIFYSVIKWPSNYSPQIMLNTLNYILWVRKSKNDKCHLQSSSVKPARFKSMRLIDISSSRRLLPLSCSSCSCTSLAVRSCQRKFWSSHRVRGYSTCPPTARGRRCWVIW